MDSPVTMGLIYCVHYLVIAYTYLGVYDRWAYFGGYPPISIDAMDFILGFVVTFLIGFAGALIVKPISRIVHTSITMLVLIPAFAVAAIAGEDYNYYNLVVLGTIFSSVYILWAYIISRITISNVEVSYAKFRIVTLAIVLLALALVFSFYTIRLNDALSFSIYELRLLMREEHVPKAAAYAYGFVTRCGVPALMVIAILSRSILNILLVVILLLLLFMIGGHKSILGLGVLSATICFALLRNHWQIFRQLPIAIALLVVVVFVPSFITGNFWIFDFLVRRIMHLPAILLNEYVKEFTATPNAFRLDPIPDPNIPFRLGYSVFGRPEMRANASGLASSFAAYGFFGIPIYAFALATVSAWFEIMLKISSDQRSAITIVTVFSCYLWSLTESALGTVLATHGLAAFGFLLLISLDKTSHMRRTSA